MPHDISSVSGRDEVFTAGEMPWHGLGVNVDGRVTAAEAIDLAGLNWQVEQLPLFVHDKGISTEIPRRRANIRRDPDGQPIFLGDVSKDYKVIQNADAFSFFDEVIGRGKALYETAGAIKDGRQIWMLAKLNEDMVMDGPGGKDITQQYLLLCNGHDGSLACRVFFTPIRVVCNNTLIAALDGSGNKGVTIFHTGDIDKKVEEAVRILKIANAYYQDLGLMFQKMVSINFSEVQAQEYFEQVMPDNQAREKPKTMEAHRGRMMDNMLHGQGHELAGQTLWGAYNAVAEWTDHTSYGTRKMPRASTRFESIIWGPKAKIKKRAFKIAEQIATA